MTARPRVRVIPFPLPTRQGNPRWLAINGAPTTLARTAALVRDLYDRIGDTPPDTPTPALSAAAARARARAAREGWPVPAWWDPEDLDNPDATTPGPTRRRPAGVDLDEYAHLLAAGEHPVRAATRLGVTPSAVEQAARRHGRDDILTLTRQATAA